MNTQPAASTGPAGDETRPSPSDLPPALNADTGLITIPGVGDVSYYADRSAGGRPLVLIHSVNAAPSAFEMAPLFEHYRRERSVFAPELPGFGRSTRADLPYSPALYADMLSRFLKEGVGEPADVVAFSLSAEFAARAITEVPGQVRTLALLSPTGFGKRKPPQGPATDRILRVLKLPLLGSNLYRVLTTRPSIRFFLKQSFAGDVPPEMVDYAYKTAHQPGARHAPFRFLSMKLFTPDAFDELYQGLELPVLVLYDQDPNITFERLDDLADRANWDIRRIRQTRGLPHWEKPEATTAALDDFWSESA